MSCGDCIVVVVAIAIGVLFGVDDVLVVVVMKSVAAVVAVVVFFVPMPLCLEQGRFDLQGLPFASLVDDRFVPISTTLESLPATSER